MRVPLKKYRNGNEKQKLKNLEIMPIIMRKTDDSNSVKKET